MSKKSRLRGCFDKQYGKPAQALFKSASQNLYQIHWPLPSQLCSKKSLLLTCEILGLLVNALAGDEKYPVLNRDNFNSAWASLPYCLSKHFLKWDILDIFLTTFWVRNLKNKKCMRVIFLFNMLKIKSRFQKRSKKLRKPLLFLR